MTMTVRQAMTAHARCVSEDETVAEAARRLADLDIGSLPIQARDGRITGMLTDRDIVLKVVAHDRDPARVTAGSLAQGRVITVDAGESVDEAQRLMAHHQLRRLPVVDEFDLVGMLSQADLARSLTDQAVGDLVREISGH